MPYRRDATRRNRNIGTAKQGHGSNNRDSVPRLWADSKLDWGRDRPHSIVTRNIWGRSLPFLVEHTRQDCFHGCTVDDVATMLSLLPKRHINNFKKIKGIQGVVLRQPTRREDRLCPIWARIGYSVDVDRVVGPVMYLDAQQVPVSVRWGRKLRPSDKRELDREIAAADDVEETKRGYHLRFGLTGVRRMQLFHSVAHEIGHWAEMFESVALPGLDDFKEWERLWDRYFQQPVDEREMFANRYADSVMAELRKSGHVPFDRKLDAAALVAEGLRLEDFQAD